MHRKYFERCEHCGAIKRIVKPDRSKLTQMRKLRGMTQARLAQKLGVRQNTVSKWEMGGGNPTEDQIATLAQMFGVSVEKMTHEVIGL